MKCQMHIKDRDEVSLVHNGVAVIQADVEGGWPKSVATLYRL